MKIWPYFIWMLISGVFGSMDEPPKLECLNESMRLHFLPDSNRPFSGHVYIKGFFFSKNCHLDYTQHALTDPFYFHVPYNSTCQVHKEKVNNPAGQSFSIVLIVQHHPLFITQEDKAFSVSCLYKEHPNEVGQKLEVSDITTAQIQDEPPSPDCSYEVLAGGIQGQVVKFASIGDILVHKWTCETKDQGILVHSCFVRDGLGNEFPLLNERGCITDGSLIQNPLTYTDNLNTCYTPINAFKFADQMIVYFSCQITLCKKAENGCEGITPPQCEFVPLPDHGGTEIPTVTPRIPSINENSTSITGEPESTTPESSLGSTQQSSSSLGSTEANNGQQNELPLLFKSSPWASSRHARSINDGRQKRNNTLTDLITVDVQADRLIIFTKDEKPVLNDVEKVCQLHKESNKTWLFFFILFIIGLSSVLLWVQHRYFVQRIQNLQANISPYELGYMQSTTALNSKSSTPQTFRRSTVAPFTNDPFSN